jgi:predicted histidine transporter YuiF (NhaC family)
MKRARKKRADLAAVAASAATVAAAVAAVDAGSPAGRSTLNGHTRTTRQRQA